jgi:hypothetical protein
MGFFEIGQTLSVNKSDGIVFRRRTDDHAELTPLAPLLDNHRDLFCLIKENRIGLRAVHDAQTAPLVGDTRFVNYFGNSIH